MIYKVVGIKNVDYVSKKTGRNVQGTELHVLYNDNNVSGKAVDKIYCSKNIVLKDVHIDCEIDVFYNKFGQVDFIQNID